VRSFRRARKARNAAIQSFTGAFDGLWLGMLDVDELHALDAGYYDSRPNYVDDEYNASGLHEWELDLVERHFPPGGRICVTGAGGGREVLALLEAGYDAVGFEPHPGLVAAGDDFLTRRGHPDRLHVMPRDTFPAATSGPYDGVLLGWGSYMLIPSRSLRVGFLKAANGGLVAGGPLVLSFFVREGSVRYFRGVYRVGTVARRLRRAEPLRFGDALVPNFAHHFVRSGLEEELRAAGFELLEFREQPYGHAAARSRASR
jgi:hypothetical protein